MNPPPNTPEAIAAGCSCPNEYSGGDKRLWWFSDGCPVHEVRHDRRPDA